VLEAKKDEQDENVKRKGRVGRRMFNRRSGGKQQKAENKQDLRK